MVQKTRKIELLSPAGNMEKMKTALAFGADAVYAGIPDFSLRVRINDFNLSKIKQATKYCHARNKKIYITINIFAHNKHLGKLPTYIKKLKEIGVDALIISDPGVIEVVKKVWPKAEIHLSTQANCTNWRASKFWQKQGVKRIILGREVTLDEIREIHKKCPSLELEYFVHGAMCMAYSGRCFLSKYFVGRSGNLGDCIQPCRWNYFVSEEKRPDMPLELVEEEPSSAKASAGKHGSYILNSKDLCLIKHLDDLKKAGITSFKIEGRAKSVYYQAMVAGVYSRLIHCKKITKKEINFLFNELNTKLMHRGYTEGFLFGKRADQNISESHIKSNWEFCGQVISTKTPKHPPAERAGKNTKIHEIFVKVHNSLKVGDRLEIVQPFYDIIRLKLNNMIDEKTGEKLTEVHGGQGRVVVIESKVEIPEYSVLRRRLK